MKFHPYSEIFPLIEGAALDELTADIKAGGLREKIWLYDGRILDGRNRFLACQKAKIKPQYRKYDGSDPLGFVVSLNIQRRHLTDTQRALAAARIATLQKGRPETNASRDAFTQDAAAERMDVSRSSVQRAKKVIENGSKALQQAVENGEVPLRKASAVVNLPKSEQLAAAKKPEMEFPPETWEPDADEEAMAEEFEKNYAASLDKILGADDKLAAAAAEIKRQAAEIAALKMSRDGYMNGRSEMVRLLKRVQNRNLRLEKELGQLRGNRAA